MVTQLGDGLAAGVQITALSQRHEFLDDRPQVLGLGQRGGDLLMLDQGCRHIGKHRLSVTLGPVELAARFAVTHG
jgi:hypothetical protein